MNKPRVLPEYLLGSPKINSPFSKVSVLKDSTNTETSIFFSPQPHTIAPSGKKESYSFSQGGDQSVDCRSNKPPPPVAELNDGHFGKRLRNTNATTLTFNSPQNVTPRNKSFLNQYNGNDSSLQAPHSSNYSKCVRVFGIPLKYMSEVLSTFAQFGVIVGYQFAPELGNWIDIEYESPIQASKALSKNGQVLIDNKLMLGVTTIPEMNNRVDKVRNLYPKLRNKCSRSQSFQQNSSSSKRCITPRNANIHSFLSRNQVQSPHFQIPQEAEQNMLQKFVDYVFKWS